MIYYEGLFFDDENAKKILSLEKHKLDFRIEVIHCTFKYLPSKDEILNELVGNEYEIEINGYGFDSNNSGFCISLPDELERYYINTDVDNNFIIPHITCSRTIESSSENTKNIVFEYFDKPIKVKCRFGFFIKDIDKSYISYKKYYS